MAKKIERSRKPEGIAAMIVGVEEPTLDLNADGTFTLVARLHVKTPAGEIYDLDILVEDFRLPQLAAAIAIAIAARAAERQKQE